MREHGRQAQRDRAWRREQRLLGHDLRAAVEGDWLQRRVFGAEDVPVFVP
jgi:hypothetical protein